MSDHSTYSCKCGHEVYINKLIPFEIKCIKCKRVLKAEKGKEAKPNE